MKNDFLNIKVISYRDGNPVCTDIIKRLIDYTDDEEKCILLKGEWYYFNDDYIEYLEESINELDVIYDEKYDFGNVKLEEYQNQMVKKLEKDAEYERLSYSDIMAKIKKNIMLRELLIIMFLKNMVLRCMIENWIILMVKN